DAGDQTVQGSFAESQARAAEFTQVTVTAAAHRAAVDDAHGAGVPRQFGQTGVIAFGLQFGPKSRVLLDRGGLSLVAFNPCHFSHKYNYQLICSWNSPQTACPSFSANRALHHRSARS